MRHSLPPAPPEFLPPAICCFSRSARRRRRHLSLRPGRDLLFAVGGAAAALARAERTDDYAAGVGFAGVRQLFAVSLNFSPVLRQWIVADKKCK